MKCLLVLFLTLLIFVEKLATFHIVNMSQHNSNKTFNVINLKSCKTIIFASAIIAMYCQNYFWEDIIAIIRNELPIKKINSYITAQDIKFTLFKKHNEELDLNGNLFELNSSKPIKYLVHGFTGRQQWYKPIIKAYLNKDDYQIITVDWSKGSYLFSGYLSAMANTEIVGNAIGNQIINLYTHNNVNLKDVHILGLSLGSHIAGIAGKHVKKFTQEKIGRISAFDPAGVLYEIPYASNEKMLDPNDALFVDVTHTDCNGFGYSSNIGHVDFYANGCNKAQPGCWSFQSSYNIYELFDDIVAFIACSHERSTAYFEESIMSDNFVVKSCPSLDDYEKCEIEKSVVYGDDINLEANGTYYLETNYKRPFAQIH